MSIPKSFADLPLASTVGRGPRPARPPTGGRGRGRSPEGIDILPVYGPEHLEGLDALDT